MGKIIFLLAFLSMASTAQARTYGSGGANGGGGTTDTTARATAVAAKTEIDTHKADTDIHVTSAEKAKFHDPVTLDATSNSALSLTGQKLKLILPSAATVDTALNATSTNSLQNKVIDAALKTKVSKPIGKTKGQIATVDATGNDIEYKDAPVTASANTQAEVTAGTKVANKYVQPDTLKKELDKKVAIADKATQAQITAGTANKWVDAEKLKAQLDALPDQTSVATFADLPATATAGSIIHVIDASGDTSVTAGWAKYQMISGAWVKYLSQEELGASATDITDAQLQNKADVTSGTIKGGKALYDWHQSTKAGIGDIVSGTDATVKGHTSEQINKEVLTLIRQTSLPFWDQNYAAYGDLSVTVGNLSSKYVIGSDGVVYVAQVDQVPAGTDPTTDNGANWKPLNTNNSHTLLYNSTMTLDISQIGLKKEQRVFMYPFDGQKSGYKIKPNNSFNKKTFINGTLATPDENGNITIPASDYSYIWQNFEDPDATSGSTYVVTASSGAKEKSITVNYPTLQATLDSTLDDGNTVRSFISTPINVGVAHNSLETRILTDLSLADVKAALGSTATIELRNIDGISTQDPATIPAGIYLIMNQSTTAQSWLFDQKYAGGEKTVLGVVNKVAEKILNWDIGGGNATYTLGKNEFDISTCSSIKFLIRDVDNPTRRWALHELYLLSSTNDFLFDTYGTGYITGTVSKTSNTIVAAEHNRNIIIEKIFCYAETTVSSDHITYSLLEKKTGNTWVDGKPIYRRSFTNAIPNNGTLLDINIGFSEVIRSDVMIKAANGTQIPALYKDDTATDRAYYWTSGGHAYLKNFWSGGGATNLIATFEYTK